jgi:diacylglycerol O-acyltransferase / wax synthase
MPTDPAQALAELREWGSDTQLNPLDALMWRTERPPANSWTGLVVQLLDSVPDWDRLVAALEWGLQIVPRFKEKVVEPVIPVGPPVWTPDENFDVSYHLRRVSLPAPGSMRQLLEVAQTQAVVPLDRNRPPWVGILVEGLEGGRSALLLQAHHVLMDGGGATELFARLLGSQRESRGLPALDHAAGRPSFDPGQATTRDISRLVKSMPTVAGRVGAVVAGAALNPMRAIRYARSAARVVAPQSTQLPDPLKGGPRMTWRFGTLECPLSDLKKAGKAAGGTVNDAFVSAILGGLREYHKSQGTELPDIPISMPVSVRCSDDDLGGNRFTGAFFAAPAAIEDPGERIRATRERVSAVRDEPALDVMGAITPLFNFVPTSVVTRALQSLTTSAVVTTSSWPGLTQPAYVAGARFDRMFVFGPLPGTSMCAAMCSHVGTCCIGINVDGAAYPNIDALWAAMQQGLDQVLALGK